ncbi:MAG: hypothetical protein PVH19_04560, partial [Planctomycetia bacterium]
SSNTSNSSSETDTQSDSPELNETTSTEGPILLGMNPPLLNQPIQNSSNQQPNNEWKWSTAVKEVQSETAKNPRQNDMPTMYGPAESNNTATEEETYNEKNNTNNDTAAEEDGTVAETQGLSIPAGTPSSQEFEQRKPLSPEMQKLRDGVRQTIYAYSKPILNTQDNTVAQLLDVCEAFGCDAEVLYTDKQRKINAFANLCYNYPCAGYRPLKVSRGQIVPKIGYGFQEKPGQMLAVMALARVPEDYPIQVNEEITGTVADLVEREKKTCRLGEDLSFKLIGIMRYTPSNQSWTSENGQTWIIDKLVYKVLKQPAKLDTVAGINRLMALSYAVQRRAELDEPINGAYAKAAKYITDFQDYALSMINDDGTWHPQFFKAKGAGRSNQSRLRSTGHILRWLVFSLPEERLRDPKIIRAIAQVHRSLGGNARYGLASSSPRAIDSRLTAVHALVIYNDRFFKLYDTVEETTAPETAQLEAPSLR